MKDKHNVSWGDICKTFWKQYFFLIGLVVVIGLSVPFNHIGYKEGPLQPKITASWISIIIIFLISGLSIKTKELKRVLLFWDLNIFVHFYTYIFYPLIGFVLVLVLKSGTNMSDELLNGLLICLCLPTTISSAVVLTINSQGNEAASIINTTFSNLLGIILTPLLILLFLGNIASINFGNILFKLALRVLLPVIIGQIIRNIIKNGDEFIKNIKPILKKISETLLLFIIFTSLSDSIYSKLDATIKDILIMSLIVILLHIITMIIIWFTSGLRTPKIANPISNPPNTSEMATLNTNATTNINTNIASELNETNSNPNSNNNINNNNESETNIRPQKCCDPKKLFAFSLQDRIAILFVGSQKTAAFGIPMILTLYDNNPNVGIYTVPILLFHPMQLIIDSLLTTPLSYKVQKSIPLHQQ